MRHGGRCRMRRAAKEAGDQVPPDGRGESCVQADLVMVRPKRPRRRGCRGTARARDSTLQRRARRRDRRRRFDGPYPGRDGRALCERAVGRRRGRRDERRRPLGIRRRERAHPTIMRARVGAPYRAPGRSDRIRGLDRGAHASTGYRHPAGLHLEEISLGQSACPVRAGYVSAAPAAPRQGARRRIRPRARRTSASGRPGRGAQVADEVRALACGLAAQGFKRGMHLAIIGDNRPRLYWSMLAAQALGGIPVPMYQDAPAAEFVFVLNDAEIVYAIVEDQEQVDKLLEAKPQVPTLAHIYYDDPRGLRNYEGVTSFDAAAGDRPRVRPRASRLLRRRGRARARRTTCRSCSTRRARPASRRACARRTPRSSPPRRAAASSTSSPPTTASCRTCRWRGSATTSSRIAQWMVRGLHDQLPRIGRHGDDRPARDRPDVLLRAAARVREPADAGDDPHGGRERDQALAVPALHGGRAALRRRDPRRQAGVARAIGCCTRSATSLVYGPLRNVLGMSRIRVAYTAGAAIGPDLFRFYRSIGINLKQLYGSTETCAYVCLQPDGGVKFDTVGMPAPGVEVKIADNGEVLVRGPMLLKEYYKRPDATAESIDAEGYFHTGDAGVLRRRRAAEDHRPREGRRQARGRRDVRAQLHREQAQVLPAHQGSGGVRPRPRHASARSSTSTWARSATGPSAAASPYSGYTDLAQKPEVYELIRECVEQVNAELAHEGDARRLADPSLPDPAQGARSRRRRADAHAQGAPRLRRREVRGADRRAVRRPGKSQHIETLVQVRGRPHRHGRRRPARSRTRRPSRPPAAKQAA